MKIREISLWAQGQKSWGVVHSVFSSALNIETEGHLVALQSAGNALVPMGAILECPFDFLLAGYRPGEPIFLETERWRTEHGDFFLKGATPVDLTLNARLPSGEALEMVNIERSLTHFCLRQKKHALSAYLLTDESTTPTETLAYLKKGLSEMFLSKGDAHAYQRAVAGLIGAGSGLTPTGDDLLVGYLFALTLMCNDSAVTSLQLATADALRKSAGGTTKIAESFLFHAAEGRFAKIFHKLAQGMLCLENLNAALELFLAFGHSSGVDSLVGVAAGLRIRFQLQRGLR